MTTQETQVDPLFDPQVVQDPHDYYRFLRQHDPVHEVEGTGTFLVTRMDLIHDVVNRTEVFSSASNAFLHKGDWPSPGLRPASSDESLRGAVGAVATADPPDHTRQRKVVSRKLSTSSMAKMEPEFRTLCEEALAAEVVDGRIDWMSSVAEPLPMVMVARILGLPDSMAPDLKTQGYAMVERIGGLVPEEQILALEDRGVNGLSPVIEVYFSARGGSGDFEDGLIGVVARAVNSGELDDMEALGILSIIIAAGGESTTSLTGTAVRILAERRDLQDRLRSDPDLIPNFVEEALRFDPPFKGHYRVVNQGTELGGTALPAGSHVVLVWPAANRDESVYPEPESLILDRPNPRYHVGFGWGIHLCVGAPLARIEARVAIETLLARTTTFEVDPSGLPPRYHPSLLVRRLESLPLIVR